MLPPVLQIRPATITKQIRMTADLFCVTVELKPEDALQFTAGQWVYLHLLTETGESIAKGAFSIASAPNSSGTTLEFAVKVYGRLTQTIADLSVGSLIGVQGAFGLFTLPKDNNVPLLCIAGGIGVTPFRGFALAAAESGRTAPFHLLWIARTQEELFYREEFDQLAKEFPWFRPDYSITRGNHEHWTGKIGRLSPQWLDELDLDWSVAQVFSCGPLAMMHEAKQLVFDRGVDGKRWHQERFE